MKMSERHAFKKGIQDTVDLKKSYVKERIDTMMKNEMFELSLASIPEGRMAMEKIADTVLDVAFDPKVEFEDTLRAKGFRPAEIRATVANLYGLWYGQTDPNWQTKTYEEMLEPVAYYAYQHQEIFNTLSTRDLRDGE